MTALFSALIDFLKMIASWILDGGLHVIKTAAYFILDGLLTCVSTIISTIDLASLGITFALSWANVPTQLIWLVNACGLPAGVSLLVAAILIRMALNLIPAAFTRI